MAFRSQKRLRSFRSTGWNATITILMTIVLLPIVKCDAASDPPKAVANAKIMTFVCMHPDRATTYFVDIDLTNSTASYSTYFNNIGGRSGPFPASVDGERISWSGESGSETNAAGWSRSHWTIDRTSGHMRIEAEGSYGQSKVQRNIVCKRR